MIKLTRVDHRLLHGQVAFSWTKFLDTDCILIVSDSLVKDELKMNAMRMAKPTGVKLVMKSIKDSISAINSGVTDKYNLFIIVESVEDAYKLAQSCSTIKQINLGGMKASEERHQISKAVFVSAHDEVLLKELNGKGIEVFTQLVPNDSKQDAIGLLHTK
ncbi:MAG: PTS sugar transporter subunit IIB [Erysipelotrichaceae bacterium]|nr:PTS sugar transporter subunit IIB [Erysipelotrichaceae bacterium]